MKNVKITSFVVLTSQFLFGCGDDSFSVTESAYQTPVKANIIGTIQNMPTRVLNDTWETNDEIGVFAFKQSTNELYKGYANYPYKTEDGTATFTATNDLKKILYPSDGSKLELCAYYPYMATLGAENPNFVIGSWSDQSNPQALDLMTATKVAGSMSEGEKTVNLSFAHRFAKLMLTISANTEASLLKPSDLTGLTVQATGMNVAATYNVCTNVLTRGEGVDDPITFNTSADGTEASAILCPGYNNGGSDRKVSITLTDNSIYVWTVPTDLVLEAGKCYTYALKLKGQGLVEATLTATGITGWTNQDQGSVDLDMSGTGSSFRLLPLPTMTDTGTDTSTK